MITQEQIQQATDHPVLSRHHDFHGTEQAEYDSLHAQGRRLYDNLRTQFAASHSEAIKIALNRHGTNGSRKNVFRRNLIRRIRVDLGI